MKNKTQKESVTSALRKNAEEEYARNQANKIESPIEVDAKKLLHELEVHKIELEMQNAELLIAKENAEQSAMKYSRLFYELDNFVPAGYFKMDSLSLIQETNLSGARLLCRERSKLINKDFRVFLANESLPVFEIFLNDIFETKKKQTCEVALTASENSAIYVRLEGNVGEKEKHCLVTAVDITNRKLAEESLADSVKQWKTTFDGVNDGICLLDLDQQIIQSNKIMDDLFPGYHGEFTGKPCWEVVHGTNEPFHDCPVGKMKKTLQRETSIQKHNGRWFQVTADPLFDDHHHLKGAVHIIRDITESKQAEELIAANFNLLKIAGQTAKFGGWSVKLGENRVTWSDEVASIHEMPAGYSPSLKEGINFYPGEYRDKITKAVNSCIENGIPYDEKLQIVTAKGNYVWVRATGQAVKDENGKIVKIEGSFQDVNDFKQIEESLQSAKEYAENLIQTANAIVVGLDINGNIKTYNKAAEEITGYTISELQGRNWFEVIVPRKRFPEVWEIFEKLMEGGLPRYFENPILTKTGEERYIIWHNNEIREHGKITGSISFGIDITERRQTEEALRISENKYRKLHESMMDGFIQTTMNGEIVDCNPAIIKMLGYDFDELTKLTYFDLTPKKWHKFESKIVEEHILTDGYSPVYEKEYLRRDGTIIPVELRTFIIKGEDGDNQGMWAIVRNISHRKSDEAIKESRLHLIRFSLDHTLDEFLEEMLDEAEKISGSTISFVHFINEDQKFLNLQNWSKRTKNEFCSATGKDAHYPISEAGVWVDCISARKPVIHNDYASLPHRKGMPEGHAKVVRELVVPVFRGEKITAILGVGNKATDYNQEDIDTLLNIANLSWEITERIKAEEAMRESEEHFHQIFDTSPIGMALVNNKFTFIQVNQSFSDFVKYSVEDLLNLTFQDITHPDHLVGDNEGVKKLAAGEISIYQTEKKYIRKDKKEVWGSVQITPIFDKNRNFRYYLAMIKDINDRKMADAEIYRINEELKEANTSKDKFFSIIAHDLKSPFNSILGFSEMLKDDVLNLRMDEIKHYASLIHSSASNTFHLLENLLEWSRMQRGIIPFSPKSILLNQFVIDEFEVIKNNALQKNISLMSDIPKNLIISADENMLSNIIRNLITNAIKFTPKGGQIKVEAKVEVEVEAKSEVVISVSDSGIGIKPEAIQKLFKIETSFTTRGTENEKGTGLGLLLCKEFIEKHHGKIWVESEFGKGSKFSFSLAAGSKDEKN